MALPPLLLAILVLLVLTPWYISIRNGRIDFFEPIIYASAFMGMLVVVLFEQFYLVEGPFQWDVIPYDRETGLLIAGSAYGLTIASILAGYYFVGPRVMEAVAGRDWTVSKVISVPGRSPGWVFQAIGVVYLSVGLGFFVLIFFTVFGGNILYMYVEHGRRSTAFESVGVLQVGTRMLYLGYLFWICGALSNKRTPSIIELLGILPVAGAFALLGNRSLSMTVVILTIILVYYATIRDIIPTNSGILSRLSDFAPKWILTLSLPLMGLLMAPLVVALRGLRRGDSLSDSLASVELTSLLTAGVHNDTFDNFLAMITLVPQDLGYYYGLFYTRALTNFIPRAIWESKPPSTSGGVLYRALGGSTGGRPAGAMGEYYLNFATPGIVLLGVLHGLLLYLLYQMLRSRHVTPLTVLLYALAMTTLSNGLTTNALATVFEELILITPAILILIASVIYGSQSQKPQEVFS